MLTIGVVYHQLTAVITLRRAEEQGGGKIGTHPAALSLTAHRAVNVKTVGFTLLIAVKQRAGESFGQGGGEEQRTAVERREDPVLQFAVQRAAGIDLLIFFTSAP